MPYILDMNDGTVWEVFDEQGTVWARVKAEDEYDAVREARRTIREQHPGDSRFLYTRQMQ